MKEGERQVAPSIDGIRTDHVARYEWAAERLAKNCNTVIDIACGVGYGTNLLARKGFDVVGMDIDAEAIDYARKHYGNPRARFEKRDASQPGDLGKYDAAVCFETIEHIQDPRPLLKALRKSVRVLLASVPNEDVFPWFEGLAYHFRHYTRGQFQALLNECGWDIEVWSMQATQESNVETGADGWTLIAVCRPIEEKKSTPMPKIHPAKPASHPEHVSILGLGPSLDQYTNVCKRLGGRHRYCDETWAINALGSVIQCDKIFHMDDVRIQELRAEAEPDSNIASMLHWLKTTRIPVITSRPHPDYPATEAFPLIEVLNAHALGYFNSTAAYAVAYAVWIGVKKISLFGCDFTYPNAHDAEKGRACVEFWLGIAAERGIRLAVPKNSTLLDAIHTQRERFYGYDTLDLNISANEAGIIHVEFSERAAEDIPSAADVEAAYDHTAHPNALVSEGERQAA